MKCRLKKCAGVAVITNQSLDTAPVYACAACGAKFAVKPQKRGQPIKHPEGKATTRLQVRMPEAVRAKVERNGGSEWVVRLIREADDKGVQDGSV